MTSHIEGSGPEWYILSMLHCRDITILVQNPQYYVTDISSACFLTTRPFHFAICYDGEWIHGLEQTLQCYICSVLLLNRVVCKECNYVFLNDNHSSTPMLSVCGGFRIFYA